MVIGNDAFSPTGGTPHPLVSVLVPAYNHEKYVIDCLDSIYNLSYPKLELLVSDDGSQDGTFLLAKQWAREHAHRFERALVVKQSANLGIAGNLQYLFDHAQGEYLAYIASDDLFVESAIAGRVTLFEKNRNIDGIFGNAQYISETGAVIRDEYLTARNAKVFSKLSTRKLLAAQLILNWPVAGPSMMIRKNAVCEGGTVGRLPSQLVVEDVYIYLRLAASGKLGFIDCVVAKYRNTPGSMGEDLGVFNKAIEALVDIYKMNRHLMKGFNRIVFDHRLSRYMLKLRSDGNALYYVKSFILRMITAQLKIALFLVCVSIRKPKLQP